MRARSAEKAPAAPRGGVHPAVNCSADDWGMSPGVNRGILGLCGAGLVRCVSMFGNGGHLGEGLKELLRTGGLDFSLHLNFTYGRPLSRPGEVPSLVRADGTFHPLRVFARKALLGRLPPAELLLEARRQTRRLKRSGVPVTGVEGHHHVHLLPPVFAALARMFREEGIKWVRLPVDRGHLPSWLAGKVFLRWAGPGAASERARGFELRRAMYLRPADLRRAGRLRGKLAAAAGLPVIVHPALVNDLPLMEFPDPYQQGRVKEYRALMELPGPGAEDA